MGGFQSIVGRYLPHRAFGKRPFPDTQRHHAADYFAYKKNYTDVDNC